VVLFALGTAEEGDREVWQLQQTAADDRWSEWRSLGRPAEEIGGIGSLAGIGFPTLVADSQGRLLLYSLAPVVAEAKPTFFYVLDQLTPSSDEWRVGLQAFHVSPNYIPQPAGEHNPAKPSTGT
jgi:hypothetical protein